MKLARSRRAKRRKPKPRATTDDTPDARLSRAVEAHARRPDTDERVSAWLLALVKGDRRERAERSP